MGIVARCFIHTDISVSHGIYINTIHQFKATGLYPILLDCWFDCISQLYLKESEMGNWNTVFNLTKYSMCMTKLVTCSICVSGAYMNKMRNPIFECCIYMGWYDAHALACLVMVVMVWTSRLESRQTSSIQFCVVEVTDGTSVNAIDNGKNINLMAKSSGDIAQKYVDQHDECNISTLSVTQITWLTVHDIQPWWRILRWGIHSFIKAIYAVHLIGFIFAWCQTCCTWTWYLPCRWVNARKT